MNTKNQFLKTISNYILKTPFEGVLKVAINGVDGSGKTKLAEELTQYLSAAGETIIHTSIDNFHNPKKIRYTKGRLSPAGFYEDSYNIAELKTTLLEPLSTGGNLHYRRKFFDLKQDLEVPSPIEVAEKGSILLVDGIFLLNHELRSYFDISIFLDVPFKETFKRMVSRDGSPADPNDPSNMRYMMGQKLYFADCNPKDFADILVNYENYNKPVIVSNLT